MSDQQVSVREIDWQELCPWLILGRALRISLFRGRVLLLAMAGLIAVIAGFRVVGDVFFYETSDPHVQAWRAIDSPWPWSVDPDSRTLDVPAGKTSNRGLANELLGHGFLGAWQWIGRPVQRFFTIQSTWRSLIYSALCGLWAIVVWAIFGGAITRIAALDLTRNESLGIRQALLETSARIGSYIAAPLLPIVFALIMTLPLWILGLLVRMSFFAWLAGLGWFVVLGFGLILAIVLILFYIGWPLMWATLSVERSDAFDAFGRCYSYVYERPFRLLFSILVAVVLGWIGVAVVQIFASSTIALSDWSVSWGAGNEHMAALQRSDAGWPSAESVDVESDPATSPSESRGEDPEEVGWFHRNAAGAIRFWKNMLRTLAAAFPIGFLWTSSVAIYLLQRREIDATEMDEVALDERQPAEPLPPLEQDPSSAPTTEPESDSSQESDQGDEEPQDETPPES